MSWRGSSSETPNQKPAPNLPSYLRHPGSVQVSNSLLISPFFPSSARKTNKGNRWDRSDVKSPAQSTGHTTRRMMRARLQSRKRRRQEPPAPQESGPLFTVALPRRVKAPIFPGRDTIWFSSQRVGLAGTLKKNLDLAGDQDYI